MKKIEFFIGCVVLLTLLAGCTGLKTRTPAETHASKSAQAYLAQAQALEAN